MLAAEADADDVQSEVGGLPGERSDPKPIQRQTKERIGMQRGCDPRSRKSQRGSMSCLLPARGGPGRAAGKATPECAPSASPATPQDASQTWPPAHSLVSAGKAGLESFARPSASMSTVTVQWASGDETVSHDFAYDDCESLSAFTPLTTLIHISVQRPPSPTSS